VAGQFCQTINFLNVSNIDQQLWTFEIMLVPSPPPVIESFALPPDLEVECNDRLPSRNPAARNSETPLREMPNAHDACAHLAGPYRIRGSYVRLLQMRSRRKNRHSVGSDEVRSCWLVRWRTTAANIGMPPPDTATKPGSKTLDRVLSLVAAFIVVAIIIVARY
jgi:hypothetical protein